MILRFISSIPGQMTVLTQRNLAKGQLSLVDNTWFFEPEECFLTAQELVQIADKLNALNRPPWTLTRQLSENDNANANVSKPDQSS